MRKLIIGLLLMFLTACSSQSDNDVDPVEKFETDMREAYSILNTAYEEDLRELTSEEAADLSYFLESKEYESLIRDDSKELYTAMKMYYTLYTGYHIGAFTHSELLDTKLETDEYFK